MKISLKIIAIILSIAVFISSCKPQKEVVQSVEKNDYIRTESGLRYQIIEEGVGANAKSGDKITVHYTGKLITGKVFDDSKKRNKPVQFTLGRGQVIAGWDEAFALFNKGTKAKLIIPADLAYGNKREGDIPPNATLVFILDILKIEEGYKPPVFNTEDKDTFEIEQGLKYIEVESGTGKKPVIGNRVAVHYSGYLPSGTLFDTSLERKKPLVFTLGENKVIKAWEIAVLNMKKGTKARIIAPPTLSYGEKGMKPLIPPNSILVFDLELLDFK